MYVDFDSNKGLIFEAMNADPANSAEKNRNIIL